MTQTQLRCALAAFLFRGDDVFKLISELSGGERAKVSLLKLMLSGSNLLLLDEPTNHLDIASREALEDALMSYEGTLFVVSHDRYFINKLAHRVVYMTTDGLLNYLGDYDYYIEKRKTENVQVVTEQKSQSGKQDYLMQKQKDAEERKRLNRIKKIEEQIAHTEEEIEKLTAELESDECATNYVKAAEITDKINELSEQLMQMYEEWDTLQ